MTETRWNRIFYLTAGVAYLATFKADITDRNSIRNLFQTVGKVDHIVSATGAARFLPFEKLTDEDFRFSLANKLMGQVNLARRCSRALSDTRIRTSWSLRMVVRSRR
jgi:NADP-dependent 3-hydroxy acid dehydrogenase YdfG